MGKIINDPTWKCDCCGVERQSKSKPNTPSDPWGYVKVDQDTAFDHHGCPWAPRMRDKVLLCGECIEKIMDVITNKTCELQATVDHLVGLWATDRPDLMSDEEKERFFMFEITAPKPEPPGGGE